MLLRLLPFLLLAPLTASGALIHTQVTCSALVDDAVKTISNREYCETFGSTPGDWAEAAVVSTTTIGRSSLNIFASGGTSASMNYGVPPYSREIFAQSIATGSFAIWPSGSGIGQVDLSAYADHGAWYAMGFAQIRVFQPGYFDVFVYGINDISGGLQPEEYVSDLFEFRRGAPVYVEFEIMALRAFNQESAENYSGSSDGAIGQLTLQFMMHDGLPVDIQITPEPATFWLTGGLLAGLVALRRRR